MRLLASALLATSAVVLAPQPVSGDGADPFWQEIYSAEAGFEFSDPALEGGMTVRVNRQVGGMGGGQSISVGLYEGNSWTPTLACSGSTSDVALTIHPTSAHAVADVPITCFIGGPAAVLVHFEASWDASGPVTVDVETAHWKLPGYPIYNVTFYESVADNVGASVSANPTPPNGLPDQLVSAKIVTWWGHGVPTPGVPTSHNS